MGRSKEQFTEVREQELSVVPKDILHLDKSSLRTFGQAIVHSVAYGEQDPVTTFLTVYKLHDSLGETLKNLRPYFENKAGVGKGKPVTMYNAKLSEAETGVKYDYSACGDIIWDDLNQKAELAKEALSEREKYLKTITKETGAFDTETGESWIIKPPIKTGKLGVKVELK